MSSRVRRVGDQWEAAGKLTLHGVTKEITLPFKFEGHFNGPQRRRAHRDPRDFKFDRRDYGMAWADNTEAKAVGNIVTVEITILAKRVAARRNTEKRPPQPTLPPSERHRAHPAVLTGRTSASPPPSRR